VRRSSLHETPRDPARYFFPPRAWRRSAQPGPPVSTLDAAFPARLYRLWTLRSALWTPLAMARRGVMLAVALLVAMAAATGTCSRAFPLSVFFLHGAPCSCAGSVGTGQYDSVPVGCGHGDSQLCVKLWQLVRGHPVLLVDVYLLWHQPPRRQLAQRDYRTHGV
jgi:hypothetical protein